MKTLVCFLLLPAAAALDIPLHEAVKANDLEQITSLLAAGASLEERGQHQWTALHVAALAGTKPTVELLLREGADIEAKDENMWRPLHWAAAFGNAFSAQVRPEFVNPPGLVRHTPLSIACLEAPTAAVRA